MGEFAPASTGLLAPLNPWLQDPDVSEIILNKSQEIYVEYIARPDCRQNNRENYQENRQKDKEKKYKQNYLKCFDVPALNERALMMLFQLIANENSQTLSAKQPLLSANLQDGARIQIVLPPTAKYPTFAIRRKVIRNFTLDDYQNINFYQGAKSFDIHADHFSQLSDDEKALVLLYKRAVNNTSLKNIKNKKQQTNYVENDGRTICDHWDKFIRLAIKFKKNIVISGGTSSGKTTFLNACLRDIALEERILLLEDTREIDIPHPNQVSLLASKGEQGLAKVSMQDLVQCCLRLRPDRIIVGEIRGKEILDFLSACSTGHEGSITSVHANNPRIAFMRMTQMYKLNNVPSMADQDILRELHEVIDIVIQLAKTPTGRKVDSVYYKYGHIDV